MEDLIEEEVRIDKLSFALYESVNVNGSLIFIKIVQENDVYDIIVANM